MWERYKQGLMQDFLFTRIRHNDTRLKYLLGWFIGST